MNENQIIVLNYLEYNKSSLLTETFIDRLQEVIQAYETVPSHVMDAYEKLLEREKWEIIAKISEWALLNN